MSQRVFSYSAGVLFAAAGAACVVEVPLFTQVLLRAETHEWQGMEASLVAAPGNGKTATVGSRLPEGGVGFSARGRKA